MALANLNNDKIFMNLLKSGYFKIFDDGKILNCTTGRYVGEKPNARGYGVVCYKHKGRIRSIQAHRYIWLALKGPIFDKSHQINHNDGNKMNNNPSNHILTTPSGNMRHAIRIGLTKSQKSEQNGNAKLFNRQVIEIRRIYNSGNYSLKQLGLMFDVTKTTISSIINNKSHKDIKIKKPWKPYLANKK